MSTAALNRGLLQQAKETVLQLELCINTQSFSEVPKYFIGHENADLRKEYDRCLFQLNSLYLRAQFIFDKIESHSDHNDAIYLEKLIEEFTDLSKEIKDLEFTAQSRSFVAMTSSSPSSQHSFQPRPLKILQKRRTAQLTPTRQKKKDTLNSNIDGNSKVIVLADHLTFTSPTKFKKGKQLNTSTKFSTVQPYSPSITTSPPPLRPEFIGKSNVKDKDLDPLHKALLQNKRISLQFPDYSGLDDSSDQETIIVHQLPDQPMVFDEPLRKYNSHESILSKIEPINNNNTYNANINNSNIIYPPIRQASKLKSYGALRCISSNQVDLSTALSTSNTTATVSGKRINSRNLLIESLNNATQQKRQASTISISSTTANIASSSKSLGKNVWSSFVSWLEPTSESKSSKKEQKEEAKSTIQFEGKEIDPLHEDMQPYQPNLGLDSNESMPQDNANINQPQNSERIISSRLSINELENALSSQLLI